MSPRATHPRIGEDDLQAHVDGQLDPVRDQEVQVWLESCPADAERVEAYAMQRQALRLQMQRYYDQPLPVRLQPATLRRRHRARTMLRLRNLAASFVLICAGAAGGWFARVPSSPTPVYILTTDATLAHRTYTAERRHAVEVPATQEAHLVQWLSIRLGRPINLPDLTPLGFRLMGGRLLPGGDAPAAQFMYDDADGVRLTLYLRGGGGRATSAFHVTEQNGLSGLFWVDQGFGHAVLAEASRSRLQPIAEAVSRQLGPAGTPGNAVN